MQDLILKSLEYGVIVNTALNPRNSVGNEDVLFDEVLYE